jgi:hypothetical protein
MTECNTETISTGVRIPKYLLDRAKKLDPKFNLSSFVASALYQVFFDDDDGVSSGDLVPVDSNAPDCDITFVENCIDHWVRFTYFV